MMVETKYSLMQILRWTLFLALSCGYDKPSSLDFYEDTTTNPTPLTEVFLALDLLENLGMSVR